MTDRTKRSGDAPIRTTVVGSCPVPAWLSAAPTERALTDATRVVLHTRERAGIDLVCDGELYRFYRDHPEANGTIDHVVRPMAGVRPKIGMGPRVADVKRTGIETADDIERADTVIGPGRVRYIHPDCGFWMLDRGIADAKMAALAAGRDLYLGRRG